MHDSATPNKEEALDAAKRLRMQRRAFLREQSSEARIWLEDWHKEHDQGA